MNWKYREWKKSSIFFQCPAALPKITNKKNVDKLLFIDYNIITKRKERKNYDIRRKIKRSKENGR